MKTDLNLKLRIRKSENIPGTFSVSIGYEANGEKSSVLTFGEKSVMNGVKFCTEAILFMAPNAKQEELDEHRRIHP